MKKTQEVLGLPIISISDGVEVGKVKSILVNADDGTVDYIVVDSGIQILSARVISTSSVLGMGEYALTIENDSTINDIGKIPAAIDLLQKNIQVKGSKVLTRKGRLIGEIGDFYFDDDNNCKITGLEYIADITHKKVRLIPRDNVITFGKNLIVVTEDVEGKLLDSASQLGAEGSEPEPEKKNLTETNYIEENINNENEKVSEKSAINIDTLIANEGEAFFKEPEGIFGDINAGAGEFVQPENNFESDAADSVDNLISENLLNDINTATDNVETKNDKVFEESNPGLNNQNAASGASELKTSTQSLFEQRQKQYLNGRKATKTITDKSGKVIISSGEIISEDIIEAAKNCGKLIELVMNNKA